MEPANDDRPSVTLITEYFYPEEVSTAQLLTSLATGLQGEFDVSVLTGRPNYHPGDETGSVPSREDHEGVSIERLPATRLDKDTPPLRVVHWLTFTLLVCWRLVRTRDSDDIVLVLSIPPTLPLATWAAKRLRGFSYAYLIYNMDPDFPVALGMVAEDSAVSQAWERVMRMVYRNADRIVVLGDSMKRRLMPKPQRRRWRSGRTHSADSEERGERARAAFEAHFTRAHAVEAYRRLFTQMHTPSWRGRTPAARIRHSEPGTFGGLRRPHAVCRRSLCTVERSRSQEATPDGGRFIPAPETESSPFEHGIQNEFGALGTVDSDFR